MKKPVKIILAIIGGLFVIGLFAPSQEKEVTPEKAVSNSPQATSAPVVVESDDERFIAYIRETYPSELNDVTDRTLIDTAKSACSGLESGLTMSDLLLMVAESSVANGLSDAKTSAMGGVVGAGVAVYCPKYAN